MRQVAENFKTGKLGLPTELWGDKNMLKIWNKFMFLLNLLSLAIIL